MPPCYLLTCKRCNWTEPKHDHDCRRKTDNQHLEPKDVENGGYEGCKCVGQHTTRKSPQPGVGRQARLSPSPALPPTPIYQRRTPPLPPTPIYGEPAPRYRNRSPLRNRSPGSNPAPASNIRRSASPRSDPMPPQISVRRPAATGNLGQRAAFPAANTVGAPAQHLQVPQGPQYQANVFAPNLREVNVYLAPAVAYGQNLQPFAPQPPYGQLGQGYGGPANTPAYGFNIPQQPARPQAGIILPEAQIAGEKGKYTPEDNAVILKLRDERPRPRPWTDIRNYLPVRRSVKGLQDHWEYYIKEEADRIRTTPAYINYVPPLIPPYP